MEYLVLTLVIVLLVVIFFQRIEIRALQKDIKHLEREKEEETEHAVAASGLEEHNAKMTQLKEERKEKLLGYLKDNKKMTSKKAAKLLRVSRYTASRYFSELEEERRIVQKGKVGKGVKYMLK